MRKALLILSIMVAASLFSTLAIAAVANDEVTSVKLKEADGTSGQNTNSGSGVKTGHIQDAAVTTAKILDSAVTSAKIANGAVTDLKITGPIAASKISSAGLNSDTVDGLHASDLATAVHIHPQSQVTGLEATLAVKSDVMHNHDVLYQQKYGKVAVVAQTGGDYTNPVSAMNALASWCGTPSATNPCLVKIMPGVYDIGATPLYTQSHVSIQGSGQSVTKIKGSVDGTAYDFRGLINLVSNVSINDLTAENACGNCVVSTAIWTSGSDLCTISNVDISASTNRAYSYARGIEIQNATNISLRNVNISSVSDFYVTGLVFSSSTGASLDSVKIKGTSLNNSMVGGIWIEASNVVIRNAIIDSGKGNTDSYAIYDGQIGSMVEIANSEIKGSDALQCHYTAHESTYLINNSKIDGIIDSSNIGTLRCFNVFGSDYMAAVCQ